MKLINEIEGEWGEFVIRMVELSDIPYILEHLKDNFHRDEPISALCAPDNKFADFANSRIAKVLEKYIHLCFIAISKSTNEIAGCQFQFEWTKEEAESAIAPHFGNQDEEVPQTRKILNKIMEPFNQPKIDMFYKFGVSSVAWNFIASTSKKYRGRGLASEMYRRMLILLRKFKFELVFSVFTNPFSRRCAEKVGFYETARVNYASIIDENGKQVLPNSTEEDFGTLMLLQL